MRLNPTTGQWEDDETGPAPSQAGALGDQAGAAIDIGAPKIISPEAAAAPGVTLPPPVAPPASNAAPLPAVALPQVAPAAMPAPPVPIPAGRVVSPAEAENLARLDANTVAREQTAVDAGTTAVAKATAESKQADEDAAEATRYQQERSDISKGWTDVRQKAEAQAQADYQRYREMGMHDPAADETFGHRLVAAIAIGLGQYSAAMTGGKNAALEIIEGQTARNIQRQKDEIALAARKAEKSGENVDKLRERAQADMKNLELKHAAILDSVADKWKAEMKRVGVPQAQIDTNKDIQKLEGDSLKLRQGVLQSIREDTTALERAEIAAAARRPRGTGAGGSGVKGAGTGGMDALSQLATYVEKNPGDQAGVYKLADQLGIKDPKLVKEAIAQGKASGEQGKHAGSAATMLRSIGAIKDLQAKKYTPSASDWVKWQKNQDDVKIAAGQAEKGSFLGSMAARAGQSAGVLSKNEYEGLNDSAKAYFENVKRILESVGREQSGAAISRSEWDNFGGQYGLQAAGGLAAAEEYARDRMKLSGTAGRQLEASGSVPKAGGETKDAKPKASNVSSGEKAEALLWARQHRDDPRAKKILDALGN